jgi:RNA polymerase sigma factor (sigma-70 family)
MSEQPSSSSPEHQAFRRYRDERCEAAFVEIVRAYGGLVYGTALRMLDGNAAAAQDVSQMVFADLARLAGQLSAQSQLGGWLHRHTVFLVQKLRRSEGRRQRREFEAVERWKLDAASEPSPPKLENLDQELSKLPSVDRDALVLRYMENQSLRSVGNALGITEDAAQKRVARALERLRTRLPGVSKKLSITSIASQLLPKPVAEAALTKSALTAAKASAKPAAGWGTTYLFMHTPPLLIGAAAAAAIATAICWPLLSTRDARISALENQLATSVLPPAKSQPPTISNIKPSPERTAPPTAGQRRAAWSKAGDADRCQRWEAAIRQIDDASKKDAALAELRSALESTNPTEVGDALRVWQRVGQVEFDRGSFRPALVALLQHQEPILRAVALASLPNLPEDAQDVERTISLAHDSDEAVRQTVVSNLFWLTKGDLMARNGDVVLEILQQVKTPHIDWYGALWGAKFSPALEEFFVNWGRMEPEQATNGAGYRVMYQSLSTQQNKGPATVALLLDCLEAQDTTNIAGRAAWGLAYGVAPDQGSEEKIATQAIKVWRNRSDGSLRKNLLKCIQLYGNSTHATQLQELAAAPAMGETQRQELLKIATDLQAKPTTTPP